MSATSAFAAAPNCIVALDPSAAQSVMISGNRTVTAACSVAVASSNANALVINGNSEIRISNQAQVGVVGGSQITGQSRIFNSDTNQVVQPVAIAVPADPYASVQPPTTGTIIKTSRVSYDMNNRKLRRSPRKQRLRHDLACRCSAMAQPRAHALSRFYFRGKELPDGGLACPSPGGCC